MLSMTVNKLGLGISPAGQMAATGVIASNNSEADATVLDLHGGQLHAAEPLTKQAWLKELVQVRADLLALKDSHLKDFNFLNEPLYERTEPALDEFLRLTENLSEDHLFSESTEKDLDPYFNAIRYRIVNGKCSLAINHNPLVHKVVRLYDNYNQLLK